VLVPIRVSVPPSWLANETGMNSRDGAAPMSRAMPSSTGIMTTTTGVLLMKAESGTTMARATTSSRSSLPLARLAIHRPAMSIAPVRTRPADSTNLAATVIVASFAKPLIPCCGETSPSRISATITAAPTTSTLKRFQMKSASAAAVTPSVSRISRVNSGVSTARAPDCRCPTSSRPA
jgi:hypothetical protein